jgi:hypothetical protein
VLTPRVEKPEIDSPQYAVVLVNEDQLNQLMRRPAMRQVNSRIVANDVYERYQTLKRRTTAVAILLLVLVGGGMAWVFAPQPALASMLPWSKPSALPTLYTGASFSVTIASLESADAAANAAAQVRGLGMPAFTRRSPGKYQTHQAMVGPFASLDEAEKTQRHLGSLGYRAARIFVDESLRTAPRGERPLGAEAGDPGVLLLAAPDRLSLVFEMQSEPRQVTSTRPDSGTLQIDAGPMPSPAHPQQWSAPDGVHLIHTVSVETLAAQGALHYVRARIALPEFAKANVRTEGRRVYVDLTWPLEEEDRRAPRRTAPQPDANPDARAGERESAATARKPGAQADEARYRDEIDPIHRRISEVRPFLLSAAQSGSTDVYGALDQTLATLEQSLTSMSVPQAETGQHQLLISAMRMARAGLAPGFAGDRLAHAQKAITMFEGAMAAPVVIAAP